MATTGSFGKLNDFINKDTQWQLIFVVLLLLSQISLAISRKPKTAQKSKKKKQKKTAKITKQK